MTTIPASLAAALAGRYEPERELGRGGMATVYLARDLRHRRPVALKVLHADLAASLGAARFLREIEVTANLAHPHVLALHDSGEAAGLLYYVMPYVEGESLRARLAREQQLPVEDAVRIATQVAGALDYAHRHGVVHRDLKPENVLLDEDGHALVADFGIARAVQRAADADTLTGTGVALGTPAYMSPEQASGGAEVGPRTDVWALGCVTYEMLVGEPPFTGPNPQAIVARAMTEAPRPLTQARRAIPAPVAAAVERALEKLPADRWPTAARFAEALAPSPATGEVARLPGVAATGAARAPTRGALGVARWVWRALPWVLLAAGAMLWASGRGVARPAPPVRFVVGAPPDPPLVQTARDPVAISADGRTVAYVGYAAAGQMLYVRRLDDLRARPLPGTVGAQQPAFSPDGKWLAFIAPRGGSSQVLQKVPVSGGGIVALARLGGADLDAGGILGVSWGLHDVIVFGSERGLFRVAADGGTPDRLTAVDSAAGQRGHNHAAPRVLPDGKGVVFWDDAIGGAEGDRLAVASIDGTGFVRLPIDGANPLGVVDGVLLYGRRDGDGTVAAVPFDMRRGRPRGRAVPVLEDVLVGGGGAAVAAVAADGTLAYAQGSASSRLVVLDEGGARVGGREELRAYQNPRVSPDGRRIAFGIRTPGSITDIWVYDLTSGVLSRLTSEAPAMRPEWTPDGKRIAYMSNRLGYGWELWWRPADGSGSEERLYTGPKKNILEVTFAPDGRTSVLKVLEERTGRDLWLLPVGASRGGGTAGQATPLVSTRFDEAQPRLSPDGRRLAYVSNETGATEVYLRPFPGPGGRVQLSSGGGAEPVWAPDGRLLYRSRGRFVAATLAPPPGLGVVRRDTLFADEFQADVNHAEYDVLSTRDGLRVVAFQPSGSTELVVVANWLTELRARLAAGAGRAR